MRTLTRPVLPYLLAAGCSLSLVPTSAQSAEWLLDHGLRTYGLFSDNRLLRLSNTRLSVGSITEGTAKLTRRTERSELTLAPKVITQHYWGDQRIIDSDDYQVDATAVLLGERWQANGDFGWRKDTTRATEFGNDEIGLIDAQARRERWTARPSVSYSLTERSSASLQLGFEQVDYAASATSNLTPYVLYDAGVSLQHQLSERTGVNASLFVQRFRPEDNLFGLRSETETRQLTVGASHAISPSLSFSVSVGGRETRLRRLFQGVSFARSRSRGLVYTLDAEQQLERGALTGSLSRSVSPSATGQSVDRFNAQVSLRYRLDQHLTSYSSARYRGETDPGSDGRDNVDAFFNLSSGLYWRVEEQWTLFSAWRYRAQKGAGQSTRTRNELVLGVSYSGEQMQW
ncbi:MAG: hypothetical protein KDK91_02695 [Gammaproteobacteria bacterium]|nr:hypothetical protein [Gammaproteobacteria bacterium]